MAHHEAQLLRLSANFAFASDVTLMLGGRLKFEELLMGRLADAMGAIFLGYATLHHFERNRHSVRHCISSALSRVPPTQLPLPLGVQSIYSSIHPSNLSSSLPTPIPPFPPKLHTRPPSPPSLAQVKGLEALAESALLQLETEAQNALREAMDNFPQPVGSIGGWIMAAGVSPLGEWMRPYKPPRDALTQEVARLLSTPSEVHAMFADNVYLGEGGATGENRVNELIKAMPVCLEADQILSECKKAKREPSQKEVAYAVPRVQAALQSVLNVHFYSR